MAVERIDSVSTPKTIKTFKTSNGTELVLKGVQEEYGVFRDNNVHNVYKLYKKSHIDGLDYWILLRAKDEQHALKGQNNHKIIKEAYDDTKRITERVEISKIPGYNNKISIYGDVFSMSGEAAWNSNILDLLNPEDIPDNIVLKLKNKRLTPVARRILKYILKTK